MRHANHAPLGPSFLRLLTTLAVGSWIVAGTTGCSGSSEAKGRGAELYANCIQCHQANGAGSALAQAPEIAGVDAAYVEATLTKFRTGVRGAHPDDVEGLKMRALAKTLDSDQDVKLVSAYVASLPAVAHAATLGGNAEHGRTLFTACIGCHGDHGQGNPALNAPRLAGRDDWYLVRSLEKFRAGVRGADPRDAGGAMMRPMAASLPDEQALKDVAAYVATLR